MAYICEALFKTLICLFEHPHQSNNNTGSTSDVSVGVGPVFVWPMGKQQECLKTLAMFSILVPVIEKKLYTLILKAPYSLLLQ